MTISTAVLFLKRRLLKIAKSSVLPTCGNDNSKSRYKNNLKIVIAFLDRQATLHLKCTKTVPLLEIDYISQFCRNILL